ncbi:MAG TPA: thiamine pyrophosphate-binding protein [Caulobacteraceae bacterium]|nr:thiamine pyrophosphate-binding protein [Caulobacteraceae bacterium]
MKLEIAPRTAAQALVDQLVAEGVQQVFCVPGESYLAVLDALRDSGVGLTVCRQEGGAAMMADAYGKATGRPGVCFVTRGPGATNAAAGVHIARQDSTPMILFVGQVDTTVRDREAWQEIDCRAVFGSMTKWTAEIDDAARVTEYVSRAFHTAINGRPGPVVLGLPHDVLSRPTAAARAPRSAAAEPAPDRTALEALQRLLDRAQAPMLLVGGTRWDDEARAGIRTFAERFDVPVATAYRRLPLFDPLHPNYAGDLGLGANPRLVERFATSDLVLAVGARLDEVTTQSYRLFDARTEPKRLVHVYPGAEELGATYPPALAIHASPKGFANAVAGLQPPARPIWRQSVGQAHGDYLAWSETPTAQPGPVNLGELVVHLRDVLPEDAIICNGAGNYAAWLHRYYRFRRLGAHIAPTSASMGYGVPAAVAMQRLYPQRRVVSINGDGDFLMNGQEFATAVQYGLPIVVVVLDNASYGTIRMHQEREFPHRPVATDLVNPDFAAYAHAFGGFGVTVERTEDFPAAFAAASAAATPAIVHVKYDVEAITPSQTLSGVRKSAVQVR